MEKKTFDIKGMHCASCVYTIEKALNKVDGVFKANVNLATEKAMVEYDQIKVNADDLTKAVRGAGYEMTVDDKFKSQMTNINSSSKLQIQKDETKKLLTKVIVSLVFGGMILFLPLPIHLQFALATIIQFWPGWEFYKGTMPALKHFSFNMNSLIAIGTTVAYLFSAYVTFFPKTFPDVMPYFDVSTVVVALVLLGRYLEAKAKAKTGDAIKKLMALQPKEATILVNE